MTRLLATTIAVPAFAASVALYPLAVVWAFQAQAWSDAMTAVADAAEAWAEDERVAA